MPPSDGIRSLGLRVVLLTLTFAGLLAVVPVVWDSPAAGLESQHKVSVGSYAQNAPPRIGSIHGVRISIPANYLFFPVEYEGESVFALGHDKPVRTFDSQISNFAVYVEWPEFKPRLPDNEKSYQPSLREPGAHNWFRVALVAHNLKPSQRVDAPNLMATPQPDNYLARRVTGRLNHPEQYRIPKEVCYETRELNVRLGLNLAIPVGPGADKSTIWNKALYWEGDKDRRINTLIECGHGALPDPRAIHRCRHSFELPDLKSDVTVTYTANWLPQWRHIEAQARSLILSFQVPPQ